ncbi:MAG: helix-turn-helix transcriptional regulator [Candidatus Levybacteria bacterium]|nr:helix-turn-helix transcriptional regulator [Candidatus Levybacteria bacterium]
MDNPRLIGERIRKAREVAGLTQDELGKKTGFSAMGISYLEKGQRKLKIEDLETIARALNISPSYLLEPITGKSASYPNTIYGRISEDLTEDQKKEVNEALDKFDTFVDSLTKK